MSSNAPALSKQTSSSSKPVNISNQVSPAHSSQTNAFFANDLGQRRSGGSNTATPRNAQTVKSKHKQSKKFRVADDDAFAESAAMQSTNSRKGQTSITHLMNFSLPPRPQSQTPRFGSQRPARRNVTWGVGSGYHAADKARYVHANYRFIVDPRGDYKAQGVDADVHLDWNNVLQVLASAESQTTSCPICLSSPTGPRMARCGHIFCTSCLIRFMHSEDGANPPEKRARWKKCPICEDAIYLSETKPARFYTGQEDEPPREGMDVVLRLVKRRTGSTLAMPRESPDALAKGEDIPWYFAAEVMDYARVMKGSEDYMMEQLNGDIAAVKAQEQEDEVMFGDDTEWARKAVKMLQEAKEKTKGMGNPPQMIKKPEEHKPTRPAIQFTTEDNNVPEMYTMQQATRSGQSIPNGSTTGSTTSVSTGQEVSTSADESQSSQSHISASPHKSARLDNESLLATSLADFKARQNAAEPQPDYYLFYQALLHYYLSPLDIRILKEAFGTYESFPSSILPRVEHVSTGHVVDNELRKRVKYLAHLPFGCEVGFLECDWTDTVPPEVLQKFQADIERRRKRHSDKEAREEKERIRIEKAEEKEYAASRRRRPSMNVERFTQDDFQPLSSTEVADSAASIDSHLAVSAGSPPWSTHRTHSSGFASLASPGTSPNTMRTVWGTSAVATSSPEMRAMQNQDPVDDGWLQGWERDILREDDMLAQAQAMSLSDEVGESSKSAGSAVVGGAGGGGKGKKKNKKITLMSTTARRGA